MTGIRRRDVSGALLLVAALLASLLPGAARAKDKDFVAARNRLVDEDIVPAGIKDPRVIRSIRETPRHEFVPTLKLRDNAYYDMALPIGESQTISPPFIVAYMTEQLLPKPTDKVLEIGTGSGYQAAVLSPLVKDVYTIEIKKPLGERAARTLARLKYKNVHTKIGDGYQGWIENAPFDKIIVTCSPEQVPPKLVEQLREGGRMVVPVGERFQQTLYLFEKKDGQLVKVALLPALFVPMTGKAEDGRVVQPDPAHPTIGNGGFEQVVPAPEAATTSTPTSVEPPRGPDDKEPLLDAWYYQRQLHWEESNDAPEGKHYVTFSNAQPGRVSQALQGMGVDGRKVDALNVSLWVKAHNIRMGENAEQLPSLAITFYDDDRKQTGYVALGPWRDSFPWQKVSDTVSVPPKAREAIVRIGLMGATGELSLDDLQIKAARD
ncbi:MAG TPA: protein-L-isoaspartate(D-aspartate) O-methyltransferase [Pirellulales bacterium]|nr:protein-L-isoaspartate(D-aspartate) O-methyltransferase [Pirellulales bacterium]